MGFEELQGHPGLVEVGGFWNKESGAQSIKLRELLLVRISLNRHFEDYVSDPCTRLLLLHEDNQADVYILNSMVSDLKVIMVEL